ncbi:PLDc N-terminal domain-containing protein [Clostridium intestinale]|uniref:PLDc N-terminal domain-containing protein n=1 Tax=Clostridium intestinale TaxID=36845 RepID=UPI0028ED3745|nr:PLDc N-terminal domain-containing protein [Clostridium intestinale]
MDLVMLKEYLPFLIPLVIVQLMLGITAFVHVLCHPNYRFGNKVMWAIIVILIQVIGPVVYFAFRRVEE